MRTLHVAAMPFPSAQGTQALVHAMLRALSQHGHDSHLACYGHGMFTRDSDYHVHRAPNPAHDTSLTSGPSLRKLVSDAALSGLVKRLVQTLKPELVIAHHVEAALATMAAGVPRWVFLAHTSLSAELSEYFPVRARRLVSHAGRVLDGMLCRQAFATYAVSPMLAARLTRESGQTVRVSPLPWFEQEPVTHAERVSARVSLDLHPSDQVALYAGNLDRYQGLEPLAEALGSWLKREGTRKLIVATNDAREKLARSPLGALRGRIVLTTLSDEAARRRVHAAADVVLVPRKSEGGVPVKMIDALSRGVPVIATRRATAGYPLTHGCVVIADDSAEVFVHALERFFAAGENARERQRAHALRTFAETFRTEDFVREVTHLTLALGA